MEKNKPRGVKRRIQAPEYGVPDDENPEWTEEDFARARPVKEVMPELIEAAENARARARGRPKLEHPKQQISIRLDEDVVAGFKEQGPRWQGLVNTVLKDWLVKKKPSRSGTPRARKSRHAQRKD